MPDPAMKPALAPISELQKKTAQAIVNIFETGKPSGEYGQVTLLRDDPGHLTYGRSQTTLASGNLHLLIRSYCQSPEAAFAEELRPYLERLAACDLTLDHDAALKQILRHAGDDTSMHATQDAFFDRVYWSPGLKAAHDAQIFSALGVSVVYDSIVHGSWRAVRDLTNQAHGAIANIGETMWIQRYIETRRDWLAGHVKPILHSTVYRMDAFKKIIAEFKWDLQLPIAVRGFQITEDTFSVPVRASAIDDTERVLKLETPFAVGEHVRAVQQALANKGVPGTIDGIYGPLTEARVRQFQMMIGLTADGTVGPATRAALGL